MRSAGDILSLYEARKARLAPLHAKAAEIRQTVLGETVLPLAEADQTDSPAVANLLLQGLEQKAMRISSTMPVPYYAPLSENTEVAQERARNRAAVNLYWWKKNRYKLLQKKRARHLTGYAMSPVLLRPDRKLGCPRWEIRDPLTTFAPETLTGEIHPPDCIFAFPRPLSWLRANYAPQIAGLSLGEKPSDDDLYTLLEYADADEYVLAVVGKDSGGPSWTTGSMIAELERAENLTGLPPAVVPGRINLDRAQSEFEGMVGLFQLQARMMQMEMIGIERSVFPETWAVSNAAGGTPSIVKQADPHLGVTGVIENGSIATVRVDPSAMNLQIIDRIERGMRLEGGVPAEFGGESASNVRTGRRGDSILSNTIDFGIQDAQQILEASMEVENQLAIEIDKNYFNTRKTVWLGRRSLTYQPSELWETNESTVKYAHAGVDEAGLVIEAGQRVGIGALSKRGFMNIDPMVEDPDWEEEQIAIEALRQAVLGGVQNLIGSDPNQIDVAVRLTKMIRGEHLTIEEAWQKVHADMQQEQAQAQAQQLPPEQMQPGATQPGLAQIQPAAPSLDNLHGLLRTLH